MKTVRFGVVGIGNIGSMHTRNLYEGKIPRATLGAVCDCDETVLARTVNTYKIPGYLDYHELFASGTIDAVIIAVPHMLHPTVAIEAMRAGLHVLTEKPAGVLASEVRRMNEEADRHSTVFGIMFNQRTNRLFTRAREIVLAGGIGKRKRLTWIITNWYRTQSYYDSGSWRATWRGEGGGVLMNQAPHNLDIAQWIFGMPKTVRAVCREGLYHHITVEDYASIYGEYEDGASMQFITTTGEFPGTNRLEIVGDRGKLVLEEGKLKYWRLLASEEEVRFSSDVGMASIPYEYEELADTRESAHCGIIENVTNAILDGTPLLADGREGLNQITLTNAAYLSAWTGAPVTLPLDERLFDQIHQEKRNSEEEKPSSGSEKKSEEHLPRWQVNWT
ncbi:MAG: Gfo/Idh/MocA family oxidoreductase [Clostridia bacterium]|nr:Gfo/Idh/MocA family oxidoreductase [Clostridia bacterium]